MDIDRIRYILTRYLRARILKIEMNLLTILSQPELMDKLSYNEKVYIAKLTNLNQAYYEESYYNKLSNSLKESVSESDDLLKDSKPQLQVTYPLYMSINLLEFCILSSPISC